MNERRHQDRIRPGIKINVYSRDTNELFGYLADISAQGMMLIGEKLIMRDGSYQLRLQLPVEIEGEREISLDAESMWCKSDPESYYNKAGFKLRNVSPKDQKIIEALVRTREFQNMTNYVPSST
ncbi:MAG: hypothetical protein CVT49_01590 [candidate division Zixibacteria bacterium HGW-Zixibacteria-1]|nr:MAG: hypothetical protein CVT49_01590 [candidate division Zixibacteria bacterium HGW-Zixibacteria-1]